MTLVPGDRLGPYEIVSPLGAGGMGEVYRARDTRLAREVALKVLPQHASGDPERLRRFEQEARAASAIDHPNVVAVHDVGIHDGVPYVVSELLRGVTLREVLRAGTLTPRRAVELGAQLASGLAAAHARGVVHRDVKPENLFLTDDGRLKVLDFGLAKLRPAADTGIEDDETLEPSTVPGAIAGTVAYMSPEQARGSSTDHRTDIFSLGVVLYEMLSGRRPFGGATAAETMAAILKQDPAPLEETAPATAPALRGMVRRCLEKRPEDRFHSAHDLALALEALSTNLGAPVSPPPARARRTTPWLLATLATAVAFAAGAFWRARPEVYPATRQLTFKRGAVVSARFTPDGQTVVYSAAWGGRPLELFATRLDAAEDRPLGVALAAVQAVSATEALVLLGRDWDEPRTLARAPLAGGSPRLVLETVDCADFSPEGNDLAVVHVVEGRRRLEFPIGKLLYEPAGPVRALRVAPDGKRVAFLERIGGTRTQVVVVDRAGTARKLSTARYLDLAWADQDTLWTSGWREGSAGSLQALDLAGRTRPLRWSLGRTRLHDVTRDGRALLVNEMNRIELYGVRSGQIGVQNLSWLDGTGGGDLTPDGSSFLFTEFFSGGGPRWSAYSRRIDGSPPVRLGDGLAIAIAPDGRQALTRDAEPGSPLKLVPTAAGREVALPLGSLSEASWGWWFPDGRRILIYGNEPGRPNRFFEQSVPEGLPLPVTSEGTGTVLSHPLSPDGRQVIVFTPGAEEVYAIQSLASGASTPIPGLQPEDVPMRFGADGRHVFLRAGGQGYPVLIDRLDLTTGRRERWRELSVPDPTGMLEIWNDSILMTPDGGTILYHAFRMIGELYLVDGLR